MPDPLPVSLMEGQTLLSLGDEVWGADDTVLGTVDRILVTDDLRQVTDVGVQPVQQWKWPRLVRATQLEPSPGRQDVHRLTDTAPSWLDDHPVADRVPTDLVGSLPDHPVATGSALGDVVLSLLSPGPGGHIALAATIRPRTHEGQGVLWPATSLIQSDEHGLHAVGWIIGLVVGPDPDRVVDVLVRHRHGLRHRVARVPVAEVEHVGIRQVTTTASRHDLDRYDLQDG